MTSPTQGDKPTRSAVTKESMLVKPNLKGDWPNIFLLFLLYIFQGILIGLVTAIPILLQSKQNVTYNEQAIFSLVAWPFGLKLLWAPLVDALYIQKIGRRKTWLIPVQILMGIWFFYMANNIDDLLNETGKPNIPKLTFLFLICSFMAATQDIAVDGWALTLLQKNNVGYASTCASMGQLMGLIISAECCILLTSEDFSNKYLRITPNIGGLVTVKSLFIFWGIFYVTITTLIAIFINEKDNRLEENHIKLNTFQNFKLLWDILKLPSVKILAVALLTMMIGFAPAERVSTYQLIDAGVPKDNIMIVQSGMYAIRMIVPVIAVKFTSGPKPMSIILNMTPIKLLWNFAFVLLIYCTPGLIRNNGVVDIPMYYYAILVVVQSINDIIYNIMTVALVAFYCRISDTRFGGTYMTLLNTLSNIGSVWSKSVAIGLIDLLTFKQCPIDSTNNCSTSHLENLVSQHYWPKYLRALQAMIFCLCVRDMMEFRRVFISTYRLIYSEPMCKSNEGDCVVIVNGYYVETVACTIIGIIWYFVFKNKLKQLQSKSPSHWLVDLKIQESENDKNAHIMNVIT